MSTPNGVAVETLASGLNEATQALASLDRIAAGFGKDAFLRTYHTVHVDSMAEVDGAAELWGVKAKWMSPGQYRAQTEGTSVLLAVVYACAPQVAEAFPAARAAA